MTCWTIDRSCQPARCPGPPTRLSPQRRTRPVTAAQGQVRRHGGRSHLGGAPEAWPAGAGRGDRWGSVSAGRVPEGQRPRPAHQQDREWFIWSGQRSIRRPAAAAPRGPVARPGRPGLTAAAYCRPGGGGNRGWDECSHHPPKDIYRQKYKPLYIRDAAGYGRGAGGPCRCPARGLVATTGCPQWGRGRQPRRGALAPRPSPSARERQGAGRSPVRPQALATHQGGWR